MKTMDTKFAKEEAQKKCRPTALAGIGNPFTVWVFVFVLTTWTTMSATLNGFPQSEQKAVPSSDGFLYFNIGRNFDCLP